MHISTVYGLIIDAHDDQLPVGLIAQLVECCSGGAEDRIRVSFRPECSALSFATALVTLKLFSPAVQNEISLVKMSINKIHRNSHEIFLWTISVVVCSLFVIHPICCHC